MSLTCSRSGTIGGMNEQQLTLLIAAMAMIVIDYALGVLNACLTHTLSSKIMKHGLASKLTYIVILFVCWGVDITSERINLGFSLPLYVSVAVGIILIELTSIFETCAKINPELKGSKIFDIIKQSNNEVINESEEDNAKRN